jgi:hypothetical protein
MYHSHLSVFSLLPFSLTLSKFHLSAQEASTTIELPEVVITGKAQDLRGQASTASKGQASAEEIRQRPYGRRSEILETVPGLVTTQHAGGGKATQYFLRGFNLDHGTDFAIGVDRIPVNMRTNAHGQGYADLNFLIPELVERLDYVKGTFTARNGDLSTAGSADFKLWDALPSGFVSQEVGEYGYWRSVAGNTFDLAGGKLTLAGEWNTYDGPWELPEELRRTNGLLRYFHGDEANYFSLTAMSYQGRWRSSDQIPERAVRAGKLSRFGSIDDSTGGESSRYSLALDAQKQEGDTTTRVNAYALSYDLDLYSDFTYFLENPERGDQFQQREGRMIYGGEITREWADQSLLEKESSHTLGLQTRLDVIDDIGLYKSRASKRISTVREDDIRQGSIGVFGESSTQWTPWLRTQVGLRGDAFYFDVQSDRAANSGTQWDGILSPKFSAILGPWAETELYLNVGTGFHSNDARGVHTTVDPVSLERVSTVDPLVRTLGAEIGLRTQAVDKLTSTLALWWLDSDSELLYVGDAGTNEAGPGSRRFGVEISNYWRPTDWFSMDAELAATHARLLEAGEDDRVPNSIPVMFSGGIALGKEEGFFGSLRARAFAARLLEESGAEKGKATFTVNAQIGYRTKNWEAAVECLNLLDREDNDIEYFYESRLDGEPAAGKADRHFHPAEPRMVRCRLTYRF